MNVYDPTSTDTISADSPGEMTVEEMVTLEASDAANLAALAAATTPAGAAAAPPLPLPIPIPPIVIKRAVSGRYRGNTGSFQLELRVDVDRTRPMKRVSGDFLQVTGGTTTYVGSFVVNAPSISVTPTQVIVQGLGSYTFSAGAPVVRVTIQRRTILQPPAPALVEFFTTGGSPGATYTCAFESPYFRTVQIETDSVSNVTTPVFASYNTGSLPSGGPARPLSVVSAYAEAGIQMIPTSGANVINASEGGPSWSNAELHASMERHFTVWRDLPQWAVWEVVAQLHDLGPGLYGIMFDQQGRQRQGCAVFHQGIGGTTAEQLRLQLYTYVHELGHCFNLLHSWQKSFAVPPATNRPKALSWMNYPWSYPDGGASAFWNAFPFQFDNEEIIHLRHGFRNNVIMGGANFAVGAALGREIMATPVSDESGLRLRISTHQRNFALGEPVVLQLELGATDPRGRRAHTWLHPNFGLVKVAIRKPSGEVWFYDPMIDHLPGERTRDLPSGDSIQDSAYIGYGKGGLYFDQPGRYQVRAIYGAIDGSQVISDIIDVRVRYPVTAVEEELADLFMGDEQGTLLYLLGSDADSLRHGNAAFDEVLAKHPKHAMANYARLVKGFNAGREFKTISIDADGRSGRVAVRAPALGESTALLSAVADSGVLDSVSAEMTLSKLADVQAKGGDATAAAKTRSRVSRAVAVG